MIARTRPRSRRGYSLTIVVMSLMLLFAVWCFASRTTSGLLRIETNRVEQQIRDEGAMNALAQALQLLEYGTPPEPGGPYTYGLSVTVQNPDGGCTSASFTIVYTPRNDLGENCWQVQVSPGSSPNALPAISSNVQW